jgi:DNA-binding SARP family transcriptional activator
MDEGAGAELRGFGGVAVFGASGALDLGGPKQRAVLALLLLEPGSVVSLDRIIDRIWGDEPPAQAEVSVRGYVSNLRKILSATGTTIDATIEFRDRGYVLHVDRALVDLHRFEELVDDGLRAHQTGDLVTARAQLTRALDLYAGAPLGATADELGLGDVVAYYEERRGQAVETFTDVRLALGEHSQLPAALASEIARQPYREKFRAQLALALYRSGRSVEALRALDEARRALRNDIGVESGPELRRLEAAILAHDEATLAWVPPLASAREARFTPPTADIDAEPEQFGRSGEVATCSALLDRLLTRGGIIIVSGEPGIGKSRLLRSLHAQALQRGFLVGWNRCPEAAAGSPYRAWRNAARPLLSGDATQPDGRSREQEIAGALLATQLAVVDQLGACNEPAVVIIDDLQWADDATLSLLAFLAPEFERLRVLLTVGVRRTGTVDLSDAVRDCLAEFARTSDPVYIDLTALAVDDVAQWMTARRGHAVDPAFVTQVTDISGGNPFYIRELIALLESEGRLGAGGDVLLTAVPHAVQDVVRRRTSRLPPETQAILTIAAIIGRRFDLDVLAGVADLDLAATLERLEPALTEGLVEVDGVHPGTFAFSHALVSSTLATELSSIRLARYHARTADVLEALRAADLEPWVADLAHHAYEGLVIGGAPKALTYALRAADAAAAAQSSSEVALQLRRALTAAERVPDHSPAERRDLLLRLGTALRDTGDVSGRAVLVDAARLARSHGDVEELAEILSGMDTDTLWAAYDWSMNDPRVTSLVEQALLQPGLSDRGRALLTMVLAGELTYVDNERSNQLFADAQTMAEPLRDALLSARILLRWFWSVSGPSGVVMRASIGDQLIALDLDGALPARMRPLAHLARVSAALELGDGDLARRCVAAARLLAHPVRTPTGWAHLQFAEAGLSLLDGDLERCRAHAAALRPALQRVRRFTADSSSASVLAVVEAESGDTDASLAWLAKLSAPPYAGPIKWLEAWVLAEADRFDQARAALAAFDGPLPNDWLKVPLTTAAIHAAAGIGDVRFLRRHLPSLEPVADRFTFLGEGGITLGPVSLAIAAAHVAMGDASSARPHAEQAVAIAERMGAALWLPRAQRLLTALRSS